MNNDMAIFGGSKLQHLSSDVCKNIGINLGRSDTDIFPDGEILVRVNEDVRGRDCFVIISTCQPVNENLIELLIFIDCLKRASARQVVAVIPYFGYGRQDRKAKGRTPITAKMVANIISGTGADRVLAIDLHAAQIQGFFDIPVDHLSATPIFLKWFSDNRELLGDLCLVSPDVGNVKVAEGMANLLRGDLAIIHKQRVNGREVTARRLIGDVKDKTVLMFDDMISTAGTMCEAAEFVLDQGAKKVIAAATHGVLVPPAPIKLVNSPIEQVIITDTIRPRSQSGGPMDEYEQELDKKMAVLSVAPLLAEAISRIHNNKSISAMFAETAGCKR